MTTLRRDVIQAIKGVLVANINIDSIESEFTLDEICDYIADKILSLRGFKTDEETPPYNLEEADIAWTIKAGLPVTQKQVNKQKEVFELETMIDAQLTRLKMNWRQHDEKEKERFSKFLKDERKRGRELEAWVSWWLSDEWQASHLPWKLATIREQWLKAFIVTEKSSRPEHKRLENNDENSVPNPNKERPAILRK